MSSGVHLHKESSQNPKTTTTFFTFHHLNAFSLIIILSATGYVTIQDFLFVIFSLIYIYFLSKIAFPSLSTTTPEPPIFNKKAMKILTVYVSFAAVIGIFLPIIYILMGIFKNDEKGVVKAASPHLFLLASQVLMEGVVFNGGFSLPIRVFVPVFYNCKRIFTLFEWLRFEFEIGEDDDDDDSGSYVGRVLAMANMVLWCFNLFGFLLPFYLPKAFKIYFSGVKGKE